jgi:hypothetical protein
MLTKEKEALFAFLKRCSKSRQMAYAVVHCISDKQISLQNEDCQSGTEMAE